MPVISFRNRVLNGAILLAGVTLPAFQINATQAAAVAPSLTAERIESFDSRKSSILLTNGQTIAYIDAGPKEAPAIVLIHGYTDSARDWLPVEPLLEKRFRLIIVDLRGHGASGKPECCYTRFDFAYDIELLLRSLRIRTADVVGHSLGSIVAQTLAELWPGRTRRLILISSTGTSFGTQGWLTDVQRLEDPIDPDSQFMRNWWNQSIAINPEAFSSHQRRDAAAIPARLWRAIADQTLVGMDLEPMLPRVRAPTLLIWGARDTLVTEEGREVLRRGIAGSRVRIFDSLGHDLFWEDPVGVSSAITDFLAAR